MRQYGWGRFKPELSDVNGSSRGVLAKHLLGELKSFRVYNRYLRTSEAVGNFRAERPAPHETQPKFEFPPAISAKSRSSDSILAQGVRV